MKTIIKVRAFYEAEDLAQAISDLKLSPMDIQGMYYDMHNDSLLGESMKHILIYRTFEKN